MAHFDIPERSFNAGTTFSQAVNVPAGSTNVHMRLVAANWLTPAYASLTGTLTLQESSDSGQSWLDHCSTPFIGGDVTPRKFGQPGGLLPDLGCNLIGGTGRQARLKLDVNQATTLGLSIDVT